MTNIATTATIISIWLAMTCAGCQTQRELPVAASGRKGNAMKSSLTNPLNDLEEVDDGIFPAAAEAALKGPGRTVPSVAWIGETAVEAKLEVNGFPLDSLGQLLFEDDEPFEADYVRIAPIHPYFLKPGKNQFLAKGSGSIAITEWDYVHGAKHRELLRVTLPEKNVQTFSWTSEVPNRPWATGNKLEANEKNKQELYAVVAGLHARLQSLYDDSAKGESTTQKMEALKMELSESTRAFVDASRLRGKPYRLIDQILEAATVRAMPGDPAGSLELRPFPAAKELQIDLFAAGTLARLKSESHGQLFTFVSNLPNGPRGQTGTSVLAFDAWYRQNEEGDWEVDALFPRQAPGTWTQFETGPYELEDLYRLSNF